MNDYWSGEDAVLAFMMIFTLLGVVILVGTAIWSIFGSGWLAFVIVGSVAVTAVVRELAARMDGGEE